MSPKFERLVRLTCFTGRFHQFGRCDYVFDMYSEEPSVKDSERKRRSDVSPIEYSSINPRLPLPKDMKMFWPYKNNKLLLKKLVYQHLSSTKFHGLYPIVPGQVSQEGKNGNVSCLIKGRNMYLNIFN